MNIEKYLESEFHRYGIISILILIIGCIGGITIGLGAIQNVFSMSIIVVFTLFSLCLILAVAPMKWIYKSVITTLGIDLLLLIYYIFT